MLIYNKIAELQAFLQDKRERGLSVGFIPTMGALHPGHISLIQIAQKQCAFTVCSIFVNPTQFNDKKDLERYPRTPEKDILWLEGAKCDALFMPDVAEMYPETDTTQYDFGKLDKILEGEHRPGHFNGVAQVVKRFFEIVKPDKAFFGRKDYQQVLIVKALAKQMDSRIEIVACPILREPDGLAMSSRNTLLSAEERSIAGKIPVIMQEAKAILNQFGLNKAQEFVKNQVAAIEGMRLEYYAVCDADTLEILTDTDALNNCVALIAVFVGKIRLIDNIN